MKKIRNFLRKPRFFLSIVILPLLAGISDCPVIFNPPPEPNVSCQTNRPLALLARRCVVVEPLCSGTFNWRPGDTFNITGSAINDTDSLVFNRLNLHSNFISSGETIMRRVCQRPDFAENYTGGRAQYQYTFQNGLGEGFYNPVSITGHNTLTVAITGVAGSTPLVYDRPGDGVAQFVALAGGTTQPLLYQWSANGVALPGENNSTILDIPTRNTEYRIFVADAAKRTASAATVVFLANAPGDPTAAFTITPTTVQAGQAVTLDPSGSTGDITRWEWDFDWQGDILEPFDSVINGTNGTIASAWSAPGRKYVRLRVRTAAGNFHEIFRRVVVTAPASVKQ